LSVYNRISNRQREMTVVKKVSEPFKERRKQPLRNAAQIAINKYFADLDGQEPGGNLYDMMIGEVEQALFNEIMQRTRGNQSKAAAILGINRSTLRKKLRIYGLLD
jgi:Fis family transcriptional regulator